MPFSAVNGQRLYYEVGGDGETVVVLHGAFADADIMEAPATGIASGFRAIRIDRRGHGRSSPCDSPISLADEAADVAALLNWFGVEKAHFLTHDEGSEVALEFALTYPERTLFLALLAPTIEGFEWTEEALLARRTLLTGFRTDARKTIEKELLPSRIFDVIREHDGMFDRVSDIFRRFTGAAVRHDRPAPTGLSQRQRLSEIRARTAVFVGARDETERLACAGAIASGIAGAELVTFADLSRFLHIEKSRVVMRRLTDFFLPDEA